MAPTPSDPTGGPLASSAYPPAAGRVAAPGSYACPMHPEVRADRPGRCPECGMALAPVEPAGAAQEGRSGGAAPGRIDWPLHRRLRLRGVAWGALAGVALVGVYVATLALANSIEHALGDFLRLAPWMIPIVLGFSLQVGLFGYARGATRAGSATPARGVVASGGASTVSMVACCAHHLADVLPILGLAGAAALLAAYQSVFLLLGLLSNLVGLVYVLGLLHRHRLYPDRASLLSAAARRPFDAALRPAVALAAIVFVVAAFVQLHGR